MSQRLDLLKGNHIISWFDRCDTFSNRLYNTSSFVPEDDRKGSLRILTRECVGICRYYQLVQTAFRLQFNLPVWHTPV